MICPICKKATHLLSTLDLQKMAQQLEEEDFVHVDKDLLLLKEYNLEN